ncbi:hypothetical protein PUNSTDRAFT_26623, partial [Punctularia strigosozonata HHB-11173 SS5]|uniref:uncharacterized protein n=1 Tax=Punctularia strigosozonata (strain HHB-11173) TaxID=741275 RepID=UPI00044168FE
LKGFRIPGATEAIITALFADDTTVYLSAEDRYSDLLDILDGWCRASRAKFNKNKTEIIPIGTVEFRERVWQTRKIDTNETETIPPDARILKDGEAAKLLGTWIGNGIDEAGVWSDTVDKVKRSLDRWQVARPTLRGKALVVQMVVGGLTQYKTRVQGMPNTVLEDLNKMIRSFMWGEGRASPIAMAELQRPTEEG